MLFVTDIGNTNVTCGLFKKKKIVRFWKTPTVSFRNAGVAARLITTKIGKTQASLIGGVCIVSVIPGMDRIFREACRLAFGLTPLFATPDTIGIRIKNYNPREAGRDRLVNALAAYTIYRKAAIVVGVGTCITFDVVTWDGAFAGGAIAPGFKMAARALNEMTAKLPFVIARAQRHVIGRTTKQAIRSGIFHGYLGLIDHMVGKIAGEMKHKPIVIVTGGDAGLIPPAFRPKWHIHQYLTLEGLRIVWEKNCLTPK